jgi:integrase
MDDFGAFSGGLDPVTQNKYLGRLSLYWRFLELRGHVPTDVWTGLSVKAEDTPHHEKERGFKDAEVARLFMGDPPPKLRDVMMIGALTGARLDAIVDLKVRDTVDGCFTFKPQKKEAGPRDVPIHPDLREIVARRTKDKKPEDDLFPEWPAPKKADSLRERSFKTSNAFTEYRRTVGVEEMLPGKRRSLVNFHSFRRWFITKAERAGQNGDLIAAIVGHKRSGITLGRYSDGPEMRRARRCVAAVKLPPLDGTPIIESKPVLRRSARANEGTSQP